MASGGIALPAVNSAVLAGAGALRVYASSQVPSGAQAGPFVPPQWAQPALTMITIPAPYVQTQSSTTSQINASGSYVDGVYTVTQKAATPVNAQPKYLVFDAVMRLSHSQRATPTELPIQSGANLTDHVLLHGATLTLGVVMTDALPAFAAGQWVGNASKSISCFQVLDALRQQRVPLTVTTRLKTYQNMVILDIPVEDEVQTRYGLRTPVLFQQIFVATIAAEGVSARTQTTDATSLGTTAPVPPPAGTTAQNGLPSAATGAPTAAALQAALGSVQGAGNWSSNSTSALAGLGGS